MPHTEKKRPWISAAPLQCGKCPFQTRYKCDYRRHMKRHQTSDYPCDTCGKPFMNEGHYRGHHRAVHGTDGTAYRNGGHGDSSTWVDTVPRLQCAKCNYTTKYKKDLRKHTLVHERSVKQCKICGRPFSMLALYAAHLRNVHGVNDDYRMLSKVVPVQTGTSQPKAKKTKRKVRHENTPSEERNRPLPRKDADIRKWRRRKKLPTDLIIEVNATGLNGSTSESLNHSSDKDTPVEFQNQPQKQTRSIPCVFCDFVATSYGMLKGHLDQHDFEKESRPTGIITETIFVRTVHGKMVDHESGENKDNNREKEGVYDTYEENDYVDEFNNDADDIDGDSTGGNNRNNKSDGIVEEMETNGIRSSKIDTLSDLISEVDFNDDITWPSDHNVTSSSSSRSVTSDQRQMGVEMTLAEDAHEFRLTPYACSYCSFQTGIIMDLVNHAQQHLEQGKHNTDVSNTEKLNSCQPKHTSKANEHDDPCNMVNESGRLANKNEKGIMGVKPNEPSIEGSNIRTPMSASDHGGDTTEPSLTGRLTKAHFNKHGRFYLTRSGECGDSKSVLECLICDPGCVFAATESARQHFKLEHARLREKICESCDFCSAPFP